MAGKLIRETAASRGRLVEPAGLTSSTGYLLARVGADSRRRWARTLADQNLTPYHYSALIALDQIGAMSQLQLSRALGIDARNAAPVIDHLEARGLLHREADSEDRRRIVITLAKPGKSLLRCLRHAADTVEREFVAPLSTGERRMLHGLLTILFTAHCSS